MFRRFIKSITVGLVLLSLISVSSVQANSQRFAIIVDDIGREVKVNLPVQRVVSIAPAATEIIFALGAQNLLVGRTDFCDYPEGVKKIPSIGGVSNPSPERIIASRPQLILTTRMFPKAMAEPLMKAYPLAVLEPQSVDGVIKNIYDVGKVLDRVKEARELVASMEALRRPINSYFKEVSHKPKVLVLVWNDPIITVGPGSFVYSAIEQSGGRNYVRQDLGAYPLLSPESLLSDEPDIILYPTLSMGFDLSFLQQSPFKHLKAVKNGRVFAFDDDLLFRPGPRIVQGILEVSKAVDSYLKDSNIYSLSTQDGKLYRNGALVLASSSIKNINGRVHVSKETLEIILDGYLSKIEFKTDKAEIYFKDGRSLAVRLAGRLLPLRTIMEFVRVKLFWDGEFKEVHLFSKPAGK